MQKEKVEENAGKSKVIGFERAREQTINFAKPYRVGLEVKIDRGPWPRPRQTPAVFLDPGPGPSPGKVAYRLDLT